MVIINEYNNNNNNKTISFNNYCFVHTHYTSTRKHKVFGGKDKQICTFTQYLSTAISLLFCNNVVWFILTILRK